MKNMAITILGIKVNRVGKNQVASIINNFIIDNRKHQVCVTNIYSVVVMQKDEEFRRVNNCSSLVVADGMPLVWVSKLFGKPIPERVTGADLLWKLSEISERKEYTFFFLGSNNETLGKLCNNLKEHLPDLKIAGMYSPPFKEEFSEEDNLKIIQKINEVKPDILWVGMTAPKQEKWISQNLDKLNVKVAIGVGAVFDFVAGTVKRAPKWMQNIGLEWFFRLIQEPKRLCKRYLIGNTIFVWLVLKELWKKW